MTVMLRYPQIKRWSLYRHNKKLLTSFVGELVGYFVGSSVGSKLIDGSEDGWAEGIPLVDGAIETEG